MKKLLIALLLFSGIQLGAQTKEVSDALKAFEKAKSDTENDRKSEKPKTWLNMAEAYAQVYDAPIKSLWLGASQMEVKVLLSDQRIEKSEEVEINGARYLADHYSDKVLYYDQNGTLAAWNVKESPSGMTDSELLAGVYSSLQKVLELDSKGRSNKNVMDQLQALKTRYYNEAMASYALGKFGYSSENFEKAAEISQHKLLGQLDTVFVYYAGITAFMNKDYDRAIEFLEKAVEYDYDAEGDAYSYMAEAYKAQDDIEKAKEILNKGFAKYPSAQSILVSLINAYLESDDDPEKILDLIRHAQKNEPNNASLYYAEGNVWKNLGELEKAIESYKKSIEMDDTYYFGYFAIGAAYYDAAVDLQAKAAEEMDDAKYQKMVEELENMLLSALEPFEKVFNGTDDLEIKGVVAEYLKNIYFRFREKGDNYRKGFEKYDAYTKGVQ